ncbi:MAG: hypothetical protein JO043_06055 [Candidatus Eremiobacteraeota bacterium]|nr:hypothetical protein [Candidatus Eremiobacteraeota bacterium]
MNHIQQRVTASLAALGVTAASLVALGHTPVGAEVIANAVKSCNNSTVCLQWTNSGSGMAIAGISATNNGLTGKTSGSGASGVYGENDASSGGFAIYGSSPHSGTGVYGTSSSGSGVTGSSSSGYGVFGTSNSSDGIHGVASSSNYSAVAGFATGSAYGVLGTGVIGAWGSAADGTGTAGVYGTAYKNGSGVAAYSNDASGAYAALAASSSNAATPIFLGSNFAHNVRCLIDPYANLTCSGSITGGQNMHVRHITRENRQILTYASESSTPTVEDLGVARMHDGIANVAIPGDFRSVIDGSNAYYVFLTPLGDTRGLYIASQNASNFLVRENTQGRSNVAFEYRIVAVPLGARNVRLPLAPPEKAMMMPRLPHRRLR